MRTITIASKVLLLIMLTMGKSGFSQINIVNKLLLSPDSNVLFLGVTNSIEVRNYKNLFFEIRAAKSPLSATPNSYVFEVRPNQPGWDTIYISDGTDVFFKKGFRIDYLPAPRAKLGTLHTDSATSEEITINGWIVTFIPNCKCNTSFAVISFQVEFEGDDVEQEPVKIEGDRLDVKTKKFIRTLKPGDVVYFNHIIHVILLLFSIRRV